MSTCACCGENVNFIDEQTCDSCDAILCNDCYLTHDGICDDCSSEDNVDNINDEDYIDYISDDE